MDDHVGGQRAVTRGKWSIRREWRLAAVIAVLAAVASWFDPGFLSYLNLRDILVRAAPTLIVACGVTLVVVAGEIDISVGSLLGLLAAVLGMTVSVNHAQWPLAWGVLLVLLLGTLQGLATGILVAWGRVPSMMVTLALLTALRGATTLVMRGENIDGLPELLSAGAKEGVLGLPLGVWVAGVVLAGTAWIIHQTPLGRRLYAVGSNREAAAIAGLSERRLKLFAFAYTGFLVGLATLVEVPRLPKIEAGIGVDLELLVVTSVVVGGVSIAGGRGNLIGVALGVILLTMIRPVLTYLAVGEAGEKWARAIQGLLILMAVVADRTSYTRSAGTP